MKGEDGGAPSTRAGVLVFARWSKYLVSVLVLIIINRSVEFCTQKMTSWWFLVSSFFTTSKQALARYINIVTTPIQEFKRRK
jgi:Na+/H+ antiporter NhaB